jgi:uncharacterized protein YdeI (YjbR/CyaY-like superfamily)
MTSMGDRTSPRLFKDRVKWRAWLEKNHGRAKEIWLAYYKKGTGKTSITYREALEEALCFGWIDSIVKKCDEERYMQKYTPRNPRSLWSAVNKEHVARLIREGRMTEPGRTKIEAAKRNGSWTRLDAIDRDREPPQDLVDALARDPEAGGCFEKMSPSSKKLYSFWVDSAKRPETRARRIAETLARVKAGRRPGI